MHQLDRRAHAELRATRNMHRHNETIALRKRVMARRAKRYNPFAEMEALNLLGFIVILCILTVDLFTSGGVL